TSSPAPPYLEERCDAVRPDLLRPSPSIPLPGSARRRRQQEGVPRGRTYVLTRAFQPLIAEVSACLRARDWSTSVRCRFRSRKCFGVTSSSSSSPRKSRDCSRLNFEAGVSLTEMSEVEDRMFDCF